jgi:spore coat polysaccharide biosynthesis protein SpsF (cytidylyltransferase family)
MENSFSKMNVTNKQDWSDERWTVDYPADFEKVKEVIEYFSPSLAFGWSDVLRLQEKVRPILQDCEIERD